MRRATNFLMTTIRRLLGGGLLLLALHAAALGACSVRQRATVALQDIQGHLLVPVTVNGIATHFVLDTGAQRSMVTPAAVHDLHLASDKWVATTMRGIGGIVEHPNADPRSLALGGVTLRRRTVTRDNSLTVGAIPLTEIGGERVSGLLGRDFLSLFDLELNPRAGTLTLYTVRGCTGPFLPWKQPYVAIPAQRPMGSAIVLPVRIDGVKLQALLDTGASASLLTKRGMFRLGLTPARIAKDAVARANGIGPRAAIMHRQRFATMRIGAELIRDPLLWAAPVRVVPFVDMLLGADWLSQHRVWISFATSQVFVATGPLSAAVKRRLESR